MWEPGGGRWPQGCEGGVSFGSSECTHTHTHTHTYTRDRERPNCPCEAKDSAQRTPVGLQGSLWGFSPHQLSDGDSVPVTCPWLSGKGIHASTHPVCCLHTRGKTPNRRRGSSRSALPMTHLWTRTPTGSDSQPLVLSHYRGWAARGGARPHGDTPGIQAEIYTHRRHNKLSHSAQPSWLTGLEWHRSAITQLGSGETLCRVVEVFFCFFFQHLTPHSPLPLPYEPLHTPAHRCDHYQANRKSETGNWKLIPQLWGDGRSVCLHVCVCVCPYVCE